MLKFKRKFRRQRVKFSNPIANQSIKKSKRNYHRSHFYETHNWYAVLIAAFRWFKNEVLVESLAGYVLLWPDWIATKLSESVSPAIMIEGRNGPKQKPHAPAGSSWPLHALVSEPLKLFVTGIEVNNIKLIHATLIPSILTVAAQDTNRTPTITSNSLTLIKVSNATSGTSNGASVLITTSRC